MSNYCHVTNKGVQSGNNVSHANNKTKRKFFPNMNNVAFWSDILNRRIKLRVSAHGARTIEKRGGIDLYVLNSAKTKLPRNLASLKKTLEKRKQA